MRGSAGHELRQDSLSTPTLNAAVTHANQNRTSAERLEARLCVSFTGEADLAKPSREIQHVRNVERWHTEFYDKDSHRSDNGLLFGGDAEFWPISILG
jgi:hypothetical protein